MKLVSIRDLDSTLIDSFSCGNNDLDKFFHKFAKQNDSNGYGKTYCLIEENNILGFFTLCSASIKYNELDEGVTKNSPKYPIPCIRIARLAVNKDEQHLGYGKELLKQAFLKIIAASLSIGVKFILVDSKEESKGFYEHYGFIKVVDSETTYFMNIETLILAFKDSYYI